MCQFFFQSVQFRLLENKLGLKRAARLNYQKGDYTQPLQPEHKALIEHVESQSSLFDLIERWLERTPFMSDDVRWCVLRPNSYGLSDIDACRNVIVLLSNGPRNSAARRIMISGRATRPASAA